MEPFKIPYNKPFIVGRELLYIEQAVIENRHIAGDGLFTKKCHVWLEERLRCQKALLTHSCTAALEMAAILCDIQPGDEIIMPSFTFVSTANAFVLRGGVPVFVDIRRDTLNIDERLIEAAITSRTKAIVPVHYAGVACAMDAILDIAQRHNLLVVEDAAQALLSTYKGRFLGTIGNFGCLSFHETKNIISGEGGALLVNDLRFEERSEIIRQKGTNRIKFLKGEVDKYTWVDKGSSFLPSELIGAFLYAQLEQAEKIIDARCRIYHYYCDLLTPLSEKKFLRLPITEEGCINNGHIFYVITRSAEERSELIEFLKDKSILPVFHYIPLHSSPAGVKYGRACGTMSVTDDISQRILRLPMYYELSEGDVEMVVRAVESFYNNK
ncbi:MAG: dTDP-4-amino-4,6-dideoxygalactose transaminase [Deltaproteobacteria bacterium HGW-Deltaproteobacteria-6]|nr:MAG: dTDP-4-amino-4,6-dideoxygalactose transaminase [Deltaproteobacteria bacterium HGW-Deltaproteobacteria-6]